MAANEYDEIQQYGPAVSEHGPGEFRCPECNRRCTKGPSGVEYGHARGTTNGRTERCPRRPSSVDPDETWRTPPGDSQ